MTRSTRQIIAFGGACLFTAAAWHIGWPRAGSAPDEAPVIQAAPAKVADSRELLRKTLLEIGREQSDQERLAAISRLGEIPVEDIPAALESIELLDGHSLSLAAKTLLIRWAAADGEAAVNWTWPRLRVGGAWDTALGEMAASWAWHDPAGLAKWTKAMMDEPGPRDLTELSAEEVMKREKPLLSGNVIPWISRYLMRESPGLAYEIILKSGRSSVAGDFMLDSLQTPEQIREALLVFPDLEGLNLDPSNQAKGTEALARELLRHWHKLDPDSLAASPYGRFHKPLPTEENAFQQLKRFQTEDLGDEPAAAAARILEQAPSGRQARYVNSIVESWAARDPEACREWMSSLPPNHALGAARSFAKAAGATHLDTIWTESEAFAPALREGCRIDSHEAWRKAHLEVEPDMGGWSEEAKQAWGDLDALWKAGGK